MLAYPSTASIAWPTVWPRLSRIRASPVSRSSPMTVSTFAHAQRSTTSAIAPSSNASAPPQALVPEQAHLHGLAERGSQLPGRERSEQTHVGDDVGGPMEGADEVLAGVDVDRRLAPDRGIDLGGEGRRDMDERDAAEPDGRQEARRVADGAATHG